MVSPPVSKRRRHRGESPEEVDSAPPPVPTRDHDSASPPPVMPFTQTGQEEEEDEVDLTISHSQEMELHDSDHVAVRTPIALCASNLHPCPVCDCSFPSHLLHKHTANCFDEISAQMSDAPNGNDITSAAAGAEAVPAHDVGSPRRDRTYISVRKATAYSRRAERHAISSPSVHSFAAASSSSCIRHDENEKKAENVEMKDDFASAISISSATMRSMLRSSFKNSFDSVPRFQDESPAAASSSPPVAVALPSNAVATIGSDQAKFERVMNQLETVVEVAKVECFCRVPVDGVPGAASVSLIAALSTGLRQLSAAYRSSLASFSLHTSQLRAQLDAQAVEFTQIRLQLEHAASGKEHERDEELSRIRIEEMMARETEAQKLREAQVTQESEWLRERLKVEEEKAEEIKHLKNQAAEVANKLELLSTNSAAALMEGEAKAIETGEGELRRIILYPSENFEGHTSGEFHFRLAESQFLRMVGSLGSYHVAKVEYILNPPLLKRYHDFKTQLKAKGEPIAERLTFHGTSAKAIEAIIREGFRVGGVDTPVLAGTALGTGVYSSESPSFAMGYIKDGRTSLLFSRVCPSRDSVIQKDGHGVIQQLVCKHREQIIPVYIVHYANGARPAKGAKARASKAAASALGMFGGAFGALSGMFGAAGPLAVPVPSSGPIILAGSPAAGTGYVRAYGRGRVGSAKKTPSKKRGRAVMASAIAAAGSGGEHDEDDCDEEEAAAYAAAVKASLAAS